MRGVVRGGESGAGATIASSAVIASSRPITICSPRRKRRSPGVSMVVPFGRPGEHGRTGRAASSPAGTMVGTWIFLFGPRSVAGVHGIRNVGRTGFWVADRTVSRAICLSGARWGAANPWPQSCSPASGGYRRRKQPGFLKEARRVSNQYRRCRVQRRHRQAGIGARRAVLVPVPVPVVLPTFARPLFQPRNGNEYRPGRIARTDRYDHPPMRHDRHIAGGNDKT